MVSVVLCLLDSLTFIETIFKLTQIQALMFDYHGANITQVTRPTDVTPTDVSPNMGESKGDVTVSWYARNKLCKNFEGKKYFYKAMKTKFCSIKLSFTAGHVIDLCRKQDIILDKWVTELFDFDGDGFITHFEKTFYEEV